MIHQGLNEQQVRESREKHGSNNLTPPPRTPLWRLFIEKFGDPVIRILLIAAFLSLGISIVEGEYYETIGIFCAIFLATGVSFWFEVDAARKFDILNQVNDDTPVRVIRNGQVKEVGKKEIVVGDIILLETGDEVPADAELLEAISFQVNESNLTGEPSAVKTVVEADFKEDATYPSNHVLRGTTVMEGHGVAQVIRVGDQTEFGKVARQSTIKSEEPTPLNRQLDKLAKLIGVVGFTLALVTFLALFIKDIFDGQNNFTARQLVLLGAVMTGAAVAMAKIWLPVIYDAMELMGKSRDAVPKSIRKKGWLFWICMGILAFAVIVAIATPFGVEFYNARDWISLDAAGRILHYFMVAVTLIVVAVPEGLPMSVTLSLALSMRKMLKSNNLVRKMHACETMGATTVICTDKTGTLTRNQMTVTAAHFDEESERLIFEAISVNTTANLNRETESDPKPLGNPTEGALLLWLNNEKREDYYTIREEAGLVAQLPFSTRHKYMGTIVRGTEGALNLHIKGAPEIILKMCPELPDEKRKEIEKSLADYQAKAMRTLAFAHCTLAEGEAERIRSFSPEQLQSFIEGQQMRWLGYVAIMDPVRDDVPGAVGECMRAGIDVKIVTGDTPGTAREIARQIGLWDPATDGPENEITGIEWEALSDEEAYEAAGRIKIMARARPTDKQRLVQILQKRGEVVAVTGDGTNDAPALNFANVGLSMGSGTSVAKEASDITLMDDSFASIASAVMWGRSVYRNIQRFVLFQLTINVTALTLVFLGALLGFTIPLTVTQMLWVNLIMDTFAAGALASLPPDRREMDLPPRRLTDFIIAPFMKRAILWTAAIFTLSLLGLLYLFTIGEGGITDYKLSVFFTTFVMLQFWNMFNAKAYASGHSAFHNLRHSFGFITVGLLIIIGQFLIVTLGGEVFRVVPLSGKDWGVIIGATSVVLWIGEVIRVILKKRATT